MQVFLLYLFSVIISSIIGVTDVSGKEPIISGASSNIATSSEKPKTDSRVLKLKNYLQDYPLEDNSEEFIRIADKYNLGKHAYLVAAISGIESTFGKFIPTGSYNAWGFGIPTGAQSGIVFENWDKGIEEVTKTISTVYLKGINPNSLTSEELIYRIGPIYAASPTWSQRVCYFMEKIENTPERATSVEHLSVDL